MITTENTNLVRKDSIEELCGHRARALQLYAQALETLRQAKAAHKRACIGNSYITTGFLDRWSSDHNSPERFAAAARADIDADMWRGFIINTPLGSLMDATERRAFEASVSKDPPACTPDTVFATMARLAGDARAIFTRGLIKTFQGLSRDYRSHDGFKIGDRLVLNHVVSNYGGSFFSVHGRVEEELRDLDRIFHVLDGKDAPDYQTGIVAALRTAVANRVQDCETEYFTLRWFKNGNGHLRFRRDDLVVKANQMIAAHYGETLGAGPDAMRPNGRRH